MRKSSGLPRRFPPGTKYVLESRGASVHRFVELPNGRRFPLPSRKAMTCCAAEVSLVPRLAIDKQSRSKPARVRAAAEF